MRFNLRPLLVLCIAAFGFSPLVAQISMPAIFGDHMVLQAQSTVPLWGSAEPGAAVIVTGGWWPGAVSVQANAAGQWELELRSPETGGPYSIQVESNGSKLTFDDVVLGEVWLCGGQSNMEWTLGPGVGQGIQNWQEEVRESDYPQIRFFDVPHKIALRPQWKGRGVWKKCSPQTSGKFSAVGYLFGRELHGKLQTPIGLISCNWGGTVAETWTSQETLAKMKSFAQPLENLAAMAEQGPDGAGATLARHQEKWWDRVAEKEPLPAMNSGAVSASYKGWQDAQLPGVWSGSLEGFDGVVWYRRELKVPAKWLGKTWVLELGPIDDFDAVWLNQTQIGTTHATGRYAQNRQYRIDPEQTVSGKCFLTIQVVDSGGAGGLTGKAEQLRIYPEGQPEKAIPLAGDWKSRLGASMAEFGAFPLQSKLNQNSPTVLHNGMLRPLIPYAIRGAIWYQGESNRTRAEQYRKLFPNLIADWRALWGRGDFPFYFVQIAPFAYGNDTGQAAALREAQTMTMSVPNTGMVVTMDIGNPGNIHPTNKQEVGRRLALWAFAKTYRDQLKAGAEDSLVYSGPLFDQVQSKGNSLHLSFHHSAGLCTEDGQAPSHFQIAGADRKFYPATASINKHADGTSRVILQAKEVPTPVAARYAWGAADEPNLQNAAGLPAPSFRTDNWQPY